jgi:hypothetical protein
MDINSEAKKWAADNPDKTLEDAYIAGFVKHSDFLEKVNLKKEEKLKILEKEFYNSLIPYVAEFGKELVREFYDHWKQPNPSRTKLGWQIEKKWDLEARLRTFQRNNERWATNTTSFKGGSKGQDNQPPQKRRVEI